MRNTISRAAALLPFVVVCLTCVSELATAQPVHTLTVTGVEGQAGQVKQSRVLLDNPAGPVQGWTVGVCHDPNRATIVSVDDGYHLQGANNGMPADFNSTTVLANGWIGGVIVDLTSSNALPAGNGRDLYRAYYLLQVSSTAGICFCDTIGIPPVNQVVIASGTQLDPSTVCAPPIPDDSMFRRGDANGDGMVIIDDAITILSFLFGGAGSLPTCLDAADLDDSGAVTIGDAVLALGYLFVQGTPPPAPPGPIDCGEDLGLDNLPPCINPGC